MRRLPMVWDSDPLGKSLPPPMIAKLFPSGGTAPKKPAPHKWPPVQPVGCDSGHDPEPPNPSASKPPLVMDAALTTVESVSTRISVKTPTDRRIWVHLRRTSRISFL